MPGKGDQLLLRKLQVGDRITIGDVVLDCLKVGEGTLRLAITAPDELGINHSRGRDLLPPENGSRATET